MSFEWDESKRKANIRKHGIDFIDAKSIFDGLTVTIDDTRFDYGESRYITLGFLKGHVIVVATYRAWWQDPYYFGSKGYKK